MFFDWDKADVTPEAASILDNAAAAYQQTGQASVMLAGHADKSGSDQYNVGLSQRRAEAAKARSEEHTSELQSLMRISYAVFCLKKKNNTSMTTNESQQTTKQIQSS